MNPMNWKMEARRALRVELVRKEISYKVLAALLEKIDVHETERSIQNKMARGTFSFAFFLQCMKAIGTTKVDLGQ